MENKEAILLEIKKQGIPLDALTERQQKALLASVSMKCIYEPMPEAVAKAYKIIEKEIQAGKSSANPK